MGAAELKRQTRRVRPRVLGRNPLPRRRSPRRSGIAYPVLLVLILGWSGTACGTGDDADGLAREPTSSSSAPTLPSPGTTGTPSETSSSTQSSERPDVPLTGKWGGDHVTLLLDGSGGVAEFDCAQGVIAAPVRTDATARR